MVPDLDLTILNIGILTGSESNSFLSSRRGLHLHFHFRPTAQPGDWERIQGANNLGTYMLSKVFVYLGEGRI